MRWLDQTMLRLRTLFRRNQVESELRREFEFHLQEQIAENISSGMSAEQARSAALRTIGPVSQIQEQCRDQRGLHFIETTLQDVRYALRSLHATPGFTLVAVLSLALGTGANMAIFSLIDSILLNSLPVKDPQQLVFVRTNYLNSGSFRISITLLNRDVQLMQKQATQFDGFAGDQQAGRLNLALEGLSELHSGEFVSGTYFQLLGVNANLGRTLLPGDDSPNGNSVDGSWPTVISYGLWQQRFARDPAVIGKRITINTIPFAVVGVLPRNFPGLSIDDPADLFLPAIVSKQVSAGSAGAGFPKPDDSLGKILARLRPGVSQSKAAAELTVLFRQAEAEAQSSTAEARASAATRYIEFDSAARGSSMLRERFSDPLRALMAAVALVMLIACANIASLLLAKASARRKEIAVRLSLGSTRKRLVRQLLTESLLLSVLGCLAGAGFAIFGRDIALKLGNGPSAGLKMEWDLRLLLFLVGTCVLNALLFGLIPALRVTKVDPNEVLKGAQATQHSTRLPFGRVLVTAQLAISLVLVVGAALFLNSLRNLYRIDLGFNPNNLLLATMDARLAGYDDVRAAGLYFQVLEDVKQLPSVRSATLMDNALFSGMAYFSNAKVVGYVPAAGENISQSWTITYGVGPQLLSTLQMGLVEGRDFSDSDKEGAPPVVMINEAMARHYFQDKNPLGQKVTFGSGKKAAEIIGVVRNAHYFEVQAENQDTMFTPLRQVQLGESRSEQTLVVRLNGNSANTATDIRAIVRRVDPNLPLFNVTTMSQQVSTDLSTARLMAALSSFFGGLALALSAIGLYGVLAYGVTRRTGEIGIRMALGADRRSIFKSILGEISQLLLIGLVVGIGLSWAISRLIKTMLYGLTAHDARVFVLSAGILALVALIAAALPARRAVLVDPMVALRYE